MNTNEDKMSESSSYIELTNDGVNVAYLGKMTVLLSSVDCWAVTVADDAEPDETDELKEENLG